MVEESSASYKPRTRSFQHVLASMTAGGLAGTLAKTVIAPLDRTKINFQVSKKKIYSFRGAIKFVVKTYKTEGFLALWRGNSATMIRVVPYAAIQFSAHEEWKHLLHVDKDGQKTPVKRYIAGSLAALTASSITFPLDVLKARLATSTRAEYKNIWSICVKNYYEFGWTTFFRGMTPTLMGVIPYAGSSFFTYETLKMMYHEEMGHEVTPVFRVIFGAIGGLIGQTSSYPLDIVRRRMQTGVVPRGQGVFATIVEIGKNEGIINGLYKGLSMNWIKGPIAVGISFTTYDLIHIRLKKAFSLEGNY
uniref:Mitochondrial coenzyme A transporter SLC25A42 n=1 Tax=Rhabditophanes sp. KR3021 TaxID=114890 RepID=A0AC35TRA6_9BILA